VLAPRPANQWRRSGRAVSCGGQYRSAPRRIWFCQIENSSTEIRYGSGAFVFSPVFLDDEPVMRATDVPFLARCLSSSSCDRSRRNVVTDIRVGSLNDQHRIRRPEDALIAMEARLVLARFDRGRSHRMRNA
jgi:hypothetical protein